MVRAVVMAVARDVAPAPRVKAREDPSEALVEAVAAEVVADPRVVLRSSPLAKAELSLELVVARVRADVVDTPALLVEMTLEAADLPSETDPSTTDLPALIAPSPVAREAVREEADVVAAPDPLPAVVPLALSEKRTSQ